MILLIKEEMGLLEWESATLDMSFTDDYKEEVNALLRAQLKNVIDWLHEDIRREIHKDGEVVVFRKSIEDWQALLKEVEDELC